MTDDSEGEHPSDENQDDSDQHHENSNEHEELPVQGHVRHNHVSARVPESVGAGVFSNGVMILTGNFEIVLDFALRMGEQQKVVARCILPKTVAGQLAGALGENISNYEARFGGLPAIPKPRPIDSEGYPIDPTIGDDHSSGATPGPQAHPENAPTSPSVPQIEDLYDELKIPEDVMTGHYANAVLIRHSATEFCFDFITNLYPRSSVSARVFMATPHIRPFLGSLQRALNPPGTGQEFA